MVLSIFVAIIFKDYPVSKINSFKDEIHLCIIVWTISSLVIHITLMSLYFQNQLNNKIYKMRVQQTVKTPHNNEQCGKMDTHGSVEW